MSIRHRKIDASNKWRMMEAGSVIMTIIIKKLVTVPCRKSSAVPAQSHVTSQRCINHMLRGGGGGGHEEARSRRLNDGSRYLWQPNIH